MASAEQLEAKGEGEGALDGLQERQQVSEQPKAKLEGADVLELTQFAQKKADIDNWIQFLSSLPPVDAVSPNPPSRSPTSHSELAEWWQEHDRIELEVDAYDMGDLSRLKTFAKNASKQHLSPWDTDLIEITLTTLFAVDKLLHLLRQRRKALTLLQYRLQWEEQVATAWDAHRSILADLPTFLRKSRWSPPPAELEHNTETGALARSPSLSASLSSLRGHSSAMSRTMRSEILSLELARAKSRIHSFTATAIAATVKSLDKLIDTSPAPLPDSFLDEQDRLEDEAKVLTTGLDGFLDGMVKQWRSSDDLHWRARKVEEDAHLVQRDVEEALLKLPRRRLADEFEARQEDSKRTLDDAEEQLERAGVLVMPSHSTCPEQAEENQRLLAALQASFRAAKNELDASKRLVQRYRFAAETLERAATIRAQMEESAVELERFLVEEAQLDGRPNLADDQCLRPLPSASTFDERSADLARNATAVLASTPQLLRDASSVVVDLGKAGIDPNIRQATKETMQRLRDGQAGAQERLSALEMARTRLGAARALAAALDVCDQRLGEATATALRTLQTSSWSGNAPPPADPPNPSSEPLRIDFDAALSSPLVDAAIHLQPHHPSLLSHFQSRASLLRSRFADLLHLEHVEEGVRAQALATTAMLEDLQSVDEQLQGLALEVESSLTRARAEWGEGELHDRRADLEKQASRLGAELEAFVGQVHGRVPFLAAATTTDDSPAPASSTPADSASFPSCLAALASSASHVPVSVSSPVDLVSLDSTVREAINESSCSTSGRLDEVKRLLASLEHQQQAFNWDVEREKVEQELLTVEGEVEQVRRDFENRGGDGEDLLEPFSKTLDSLTVRYDAIDLDTLTSSSTALLASPSSTNPLFQSQHEQRQVSLHQLLARHTSTSATVSSLEAAIDQATLARRAREEAERRRQEEESRLLAEWRERFARLVGEMEASCTSAKALEGEAREAVQRAEVWMSEAKEERGRLLDIDDLTTTTEVDLGGLEEARASLARLQHAVTTFESASITHSAQLASFNADTPSLATSELSPAHGLHASLTHSLAAAKASLADLEHEIGQADHEGEAWRGARDARIEERRFKAEQYARRVSAWKARQAELHRQLAEKLAAVAAVGKEAESRCLALLCSRAQVEDVRASLLTVDELDEASHLDDPLLRDTSSSLLSLRSQLDAFTSSSTEHYHSFAALQASLPERGDSTLDASHTVELHQQAQDALASCTASIARLEDAVSVAAEEHDRWSAQRAAVLERRREKEQAAVKEQAAAAAAAAAAQEDERIQLASKARHAAEREALARSAVESNHPLPELVVVESEVPSPASRTRLNGQGLPLEQPATANGSRRSRTSGRKSVASEADIEDVFGQRRSIPPFPFDDSGSSHVPVEVAALRAQVDSIVVDVWLDSNAVLHLPSVVEADNLRRDLSTMEDEMEAASTSAGTLWVDLEPLKEELERKTKVVERISSLAHFSAKLDGADEALSNLLNSIDASSSTEPLPSDDDPFAFPSPSSSTSLADALLAASDAVTAVRKGAIPVVDDARVKAHIERIEESFSEMMALVGELGPLRSSSSASSTPSSTSLRIPQATSRSSTWSSTRSTSRPPSSASSSSRRSTMDPPPSRPTSSRETPSRQSTSSLKTPTRRTSLANDATPRRRTSSAIPLSTPRPTSTVPRGFNFASTTKKTPRDDLSRSTSNIPRSASRRSSIAPPTPSLSLSSSTSRRDSLASMSSSTSSRRISQAFSTPSRYSKSSLEEQRRKSSTFSPPKVKRPYRADASRKVDVEVGRIVNQLDIHVPITAAKGAANDSSGMYWIGEADTGRLYFIRVLVSQCMVRVGGGWQGLLPFIISHFGSQEGLTISPRISPSTSLQSNDPHWISSSTLGASHSSTSSLANFLSASTSSSLLSASVSSNGRRTFSGAISPLRRSSRSSFGGLAASTSSANLGTPKTTHKPLPQWRP